MTLALAAIVPVPSCWSVVDSQIPHDPSSADSASASLLTLPANAEPNDYTALVGAQVAGGSGVRVGAAAAARTTFTVEPANFLQARWLQLKRFFADNRPWTWLVPALLAFALATSLVRKRFRFTVARRA